VKPIHQSDLYRSRLTAAGRLRAIEAEIAGLLRSFPDLPVRPRVRVHAPRRHRAGVPVLMSRLRQKLH
jgi:hypothetical protein